MSLESIELQYITLLCQFLSQLSVCDIKYGYFSLLVNKPADDTGPLDLLFTLCERYIRIILIMPQRTN